MYATAHRVLSRRTGKTGINAFRYRHPGTVPDVDWSAPDVQLIADRSPGELVGEVIEIPPGANEVLSYLDVAASDSFATPAVLAVLREAAPRVPRGETHFTQSAPGVSVRFGAQLGLAGAEQIEFRELSERIRTLLEQPPATWRQKIPLDITTVVHAAGYLCTLPAESIVRVRAIRGPDWTPASVRFDRSVEEDYGRVRGELLPEVAQLLTGLSLDELLALGGIAFVDPNGRILRTWPERG